MYGYEEKFSGARLICKFYGNRYGWDRDEAAHLAHQWDADELLWLSDCWRQRPRMWQDQEVWWHGDATPANFLLGGLGSQIATVSGCSRNVTSGPCRMTVYGEG